MSALVWFRRDLRLTDNPAWAAAMADHDEVTALFVLDQRLLDPAGRPRRDLLFAHLHALDADLRNLGGSLLVETGDPESTVPAIANRHDAVYWNRDYTPFARGRDRAVAEATRSEIELHDGNVVHAPGIVMTGEGTPYRVFTPFYRSWSATPIEPWPQTGTATVTGHRDAEVPNVPSPIMEPGELGAHNRLERFLEVVDDYKEDHNRPDLDHTSHLSVDLKFGTISGRRIIEQVGTATDGREAFIRQLAWRDFYAQVLFHAPHTTNNPFRDDLGEIVWAVDDEAVEAWKDGKTGYPLVDAGMRQLQAEGWMHNRVRMVAASFLVKDLGIDWRIGERYFRRLLIDADTAQNVGNWQWVAGTGADAAPYFRIMNPITQSRRFDPDGTYIRRYVPELSALDAATIHEPWEHPLEAAAAGVTLGEDYPYPMVDHAEAREITLQRFEAAKA